MAGLDAERVLRLFAELGEKLARPATLCLIGSTPGIASGQPSRQTADIDLWQEASDYDTGDLARACDELSVAFNPRGELERDTVYIQIVSPGIVRLPAGFSVEMLGRFGNLTVVMPKPELLVAAKLVRASETDIQDVTWWMRERALDVDAVKTAIGTLPNVRDRETAAENLILIRLTEDPT